MSKSANTRDFHFSWRGLKYAITSVNNRNLMVGGVLALVFGAWVRTTEMAIVGYFIISIALLGMLLLIVASLESYNTAVFSKKNAMLSNWARSGKGQEQARRRQMVESTNVDEAIVMAGLPVGGLMFNTDGAMFLPGGTLNDINGHTLGASDIHNPVLNPETGYWVDIETAYTAPDFGSDSNLSSTSDIQMNSDSGIDWT